MKETRTHWNYLLTLLLRTWPNQQGLRVFELHKSHGLHVHLPTNRFINVNEARILAEKAGWGRIHVQRMPAEHAGYPIPQRGLRRLIDFSAPTPSSGHCMVMGTASTMACVFEAMGLFPPGSATIPGPDSWRLQLAEYVGRRAVAMALDPFLPSRIVTPASLENGLRMLHAIGGSTNAIVHLIAIARRAGYALSLSGPLRPARPRRC